MSQKSVFTISMVLKFPNGEIKNTYDVIQTTEAVSSYDLMAFARDAWDRVGVKVTAGYCTRVG